MQRRSFLRAGATAAALGATGLLPRLGWTETAAPAAQRGASAPVRLMSNENPLGLPEGSRQAAAEALANGHRYPGLRGQMTAALAAKDGVRTGDILLGSGSTEVLEMVGRAVATMAPGARAILPDPTFEHTERYLRPHGIEMVKVPLRSDHAHDLEAMRRLSEASTEPTLVFLCNPNNPTGTLTSCDEIERWIVSAPEHVYFLVDEAYYEFADDPAFRSMASLIERSERVIVSRTFSKIYGMAGLRLGYGIGRGAFLRRAGSFAMANNCTDVAAAAGLAALRDEAYFRRSLEINARGRAICSAVLEELELAYLPSHTNFVMHRITGSHRDYVARMLEAGFRVGRAFPPMTDYNRVSIGMPEDMERWAEALRGFRRQGWI